MEFVLIENAMYRTLFKGVWLSERLELTGIYDRYNINLSQNYKNYKNVENRKPISLLLFVWFEKYTYLCKVLSFLLIALEYSQRRYGRFYASRKVLSNLGHYIY